jgi:TonB family protein
VGDYSNESNSELAGYVQTLPDIIRQFWKLPSYLKEKNLSCQIRVYIAASGNILKIDMHKSSGNEEYDSRAEKALRDAAPFPKPSALVAERLTRSGIILGFPL